MRHAAVLLLCINLSACAPQLLVRPEHVLLTAAEPSAAVEWSSQGLAALTLDGQALARSGVMDLRLAPEACARAVRFEGRTRAAESLVRIVRLARAPTLAGVMLVDEMTAEAFPVEELPAGDGDRRFRARLPEHRFAALTLSVSCAERCEFLRVTAEGEAGSSNTVAAEDGVCVHQIGDPMPLDRLFRVRILGTDASEAGPFLVEVLQAPSAAHAGVP